MHTNSVYKPIRHLSSKFFVQATRNAKKVSASGWILVS